MRTTSGTFELSLSAGGVDDEVVTFEVEVTAEITEAQPERGPTHDSGGEPACDGYAEITDIYFSDPSQKTNGPHLSVWRKASWLLDILPQSGLDAWAVTLYENAGHPDEDRP